MGQLPIEHVMPDTVFDKVGMNYEGLVCMKQGSVCKPTIMKAYISAFVSWPIKAVHLDLVSDLISEVFIACLRCLIAHHGKLSLIWSDHRTNFVGALCLFKELLEFLQQLKMMETVFNFCTSQYIEWVSSLKEHHTFGSLWEAAVKSAKAHLTCIIANTYL